MSSNHNCEGSCCKSVPNASVVQNLDEMEFERGIWQAALDNDVEKVRNLIVGRKIHPDLQDSYGYTALHYAARKGNLESAKLLLEFGASVNLRTRSNGTTAMHRAVLNRQIPMIEFLIKKKADLDIKDNDGFTAYERAIKEGDEEVIKTFKTHVDKYKLTNN